MPTKFVNKLGKNRRYLEPMYSKAGGAFPKDPDPLPAPYRMVEGRFYTGSVGESLEGRFLGTGTDYEELEDGVGNFTTAIVELPDGTVRTTPIENIRFTTGLMDTDTDTDTDTEAPDAD